MSERYLNRNQVRELDRHAIEVFGVPSIVLMENAGRAIADLLLEQHNLSHVLICCGKGNNGGDGFVIARYLDNKARSVEVVLFADPEDLSQDARTNYDIVCNSGIQVTCIPPESIDVPEFADKCQRSDWIVDSLFGSGLTGPLRSPFDALVGAINDAEKKVIAVDVPSGFDGDAGEPYGSCIRATLTAAIVAARPGFRSEQAAEWIGQVRVIDIGIPRKAFDTFEVLSKD